MLPHAGACQDLPAPEHGPSQGHRGPRGARHVQGHPGPSGAELTAQGPQEGAAEPAGQALGEQDHQRGHGRGGGVHNGCLQQPGGPQPSIWPARGDSCAGPKEKGLQHGGQVSD